MEVIVLTYTTGEGTEREPAHPHKVVYTLDGQLVANECSYWPHQNEDTLP